MFQHSLDTITGVDPAGRLLPLCASISHPDKETILVKWRAPYDAALFSLGPNTLIAIGDGVDTFTFRVALKEGETVLGFSRDEDARTLTIKTYGG